MGESLKRVLIVDDEPSIRDSLRLLLKSHFEVSTACDGEQALGMIDEFGPDLVLLDVMMPKLGGLETLRALRDRECSTPVIMLTAAGTVKTAVEAMKCGAIDYLNKPFDVEELTALMVETLSGATQTAPGTGGARPALPLPEADFGPLVGRAPAMVDLFQQVRQVAGRNATVLITGESGTGKELVARQIHTCSQRSSGPFIAINCAAIPETLIESELFGHEKGAFTNAIEKRIGHFELADGGTLFLDEIGELSLPVQVKMLRFLQEQEFYRVGRSKPVKVDVRIIAATNRNLEDLVREKRFRQDLFYRVNVVSFQIPPLRDRFEDIPQLAHHFINKFRPAYGDRIQGVSEGAMKALVEYEWPGNVRELENVIESLMALCPGEEISEGDLPRKIATGGERVTVLRPPSGESSMSFDEAERLFETEMIVKALRKTNYVQTRAAELLGISRRILKYKMDKLGISDAPAPGAVRVGAGSDLPPEPVV